MLLATNCQVHIIRNQSVRVLIIVGIAHRDYRRDRCSTLRTRHAFMFSEWWSLFWNIKALLKYQRSELNEFKQLRWYLMGKKYMAWFNCHGFFIENSPLSVEKLNPSIQHEKCVLTRFTKANIVKTEALIWPWQMCKCQAVIHLLLLLISYLLKTFPREMR